MILDFGDSESASDLRCDVCIVGAGAAGLTIALELMGSGLDVLILESGGLDAEDDTQKLYAGTVADSRLHSPPDRYRQRRLGGSTTIWGGRCMPLDAIDLEPRSFVADSGWPISYDELQPFYRRANELCEAGRFAYTTGEAFDRPLAPMLDGFSNQHFTTDTLERFSCPTDFGQRYRHKLQSARNIRLVLHANVTGIKLDEAGSRVTSLAIRNLRGKEAVVCAGVFVLATGGIETARLLLANRDVQKNGIGNEHDLVGRYYMCHLAGTVGAIKVDRPLSAVWHGYDVADDGTYCRRRFALRPDVQRRLGLGNFVARLHHPRITDPAHKNSILSLLFLAKFLIPYEYRSRLHGTEATTAAQLLQHMANVALRPWDAGLFALHMLKDRRLAERKFPSIIIKSRANLYSLDFHAEQHPNPLSRISLGSDRDALGIPQVHVDWRYTRADVDTVTRSIGLLAEDFQKSKLGTFDYVPEDLEAEMTRYGAYGGHHIGTARMGLDPKTSVVDANCRVHSLNNFYIASAAVFPTSSQANPTLTIVALAARLAKHLNGMRGPASAVPSVRSAEAHQPQNIEQPTARRRIAVVGGDGSVGARIIRALADTGWAEPYEIIVGHAGATAGKPTASHTVMPGDAAAWDAAVAGCDGVVLSLSGQASRFASITRDAIEAVVRSRAGVRVVNISSMSVYGEATGLVDETCSPLGELSAYAQSRLEAEAIADAYAHVVTLRPGCEYGPDCPEWSQRVARWLLARRIGDLGPNGDGYCNLIYIDDLVASAVKALIAKDVEGQKFNLAAPEPPTWNEYFTAFAQAINAVPVRRVTKRRLAIETKLVAVPLKVGELVATRLGLPAFTIPPAIPPSLASLCRQEIRLDVAKAQTMLAMEWTSLSAGLRSAAASIGR